MQRVRTRVSDDRFAQLASEVAPLRVANLAQRARDAIVRAARRLLKPALSAIGALLLLHCSGEDTITNTVPPAQGGAPSQGTAEGGAPSQGTAAGIPKTIYEVLDLINGLPHPVQLSDFLASLERPLALNANFNTQSAQPALGKRSPRIFIIIDKSFSMSLVPGAEPTLEFGERDASGLRSVKGEVHFPVEGQLSPEDAFARLAPAASTGLTLDQATLCGACHNNEEPAPGYPFRGAFSSEILKPTPFFSVDVAAMRREHEACDSAMEPERCAVFRAIFDHGDVVQTPFL
jgi:cytochrome c553